MIEEFGKGVKRAAGTALLMTITACQNLPPLPDIPILTTKDAHTGETKISKCAMFGGAAAIGTALLSDDNKLLKSIGAGAAGCAAGHFAFDRIENELGEELRSVGVQLKRNAENNSLELITPGNVVFDSGSSDIKADFYEILNSVAKILAEYDDLDITIEGHTDSDGPSNYNMKLSQDRANNVKNYLDAQDGIDGSRLQAVGYGETQLIHGANGQEDKSASRRTIIEIEPSGTGQ